MDKEQAYCCLNCGESAGCCETCGECLACCEGCGDTSMCQPSAYFNNGSFYKNFTSTHFDSINSDYSDTSCVSTNSSSYTSTYKSKDSQCSVTGSSQSSNCCDDGDVTHAKWSCSGITCYGLACDNNEDCWIDGGGCNGSCRSDCGGTYTPSCGSCTDDTCGTFDHGCSGLGCTCDPGDECEGSYVSVHTAKIIFTDSVKLYNKEGQDVGNIIGATYDPCSPCATWNAPACHFFAP